MADIPMYWRELIPLDKSHKIAKWLWMNQILVESGLKGKSVSREGARAGSHKSK